jgi:hypothetical protein
VILIVAVAQTVWITLKTAPAEARTDADEPQTAKPTPESQARGLGSSGDQ